MSFLTGNDYKRGFESGYNDAFNGKDKWNLRANFVMGWSLKFAIHGNIALDTFAQGYNDGYYEGIKVKNAIHKVELTNSTENIILKNNTNKLNLKTNSMTQNYEQQLQALIELQSFLTQFKEDLKTRMSIYNDRVHNLRNSGLTIQIADNYDANYCIPNQQMIFRLIQEIEQKDTPFVNENISVVQQAMEIARRQYQ
jgi:hypothetical protein